MNKKIVTVSDGLLHFMERARELARRVDRGETFEPSVVTYVEVKPTEVANHLLDGDFDSEPMQMPARVGR